MKSYTLHGLDMAYLPVQEAASQREVFAQILNDQ
jgi:hypothetical protein